MGAPDHRTPERAAREAGSAHPAPRTRSPVVRFLRVPGPGLVTGAADDDPAGVATYAQAGATYGVGLLWTASVSLPLRMASQEICDRMALATGDSLGRLIRRRFSHGARTVAGVLLVALIVANVLNLGADLMAIGQGVQLLGAGPAPAWSAVVGVGIAAGTFLIIIIMLVAGHRAIMGSYRNGRLAHVLGWAVTVLMCAAGIYGTWFAVSGG